MRFSDALDQAQALQAAGEGTGVAGGELPVQATGAPRAAFLACPFRDGARLSPISISARTAAARLGIRRA